MSVSEPETSSEEKQSNLPAGEPARAARPRWQRPLVFSPLALGLLLWSAFLIDERGDAGFWRGTRVLGVDLSALEREAALTRLRPAAREREERAIALRVERLARALSPNAVGLSFDLARTLDRIAREQREQRGLRHFGSWLVSWLRNPAECSAEVRVDAERFETGLRDLERLAVTLPFAGAFRVEAGRVVPDYPRPGRRIERAAARRSWLEALQNGARELTLQTVAAPAPFPPEVVDRWVAQATNVAQADVSLLDAATGRRLTVRGEELLGALQVSNSGEGAPRLVINAEQLLPALGDRLSAVENAATPARFEVLPLDQVRLLPSAPEQRVDRGRASEALLMAAASPSREGALPLLRVSEPELTTAAAEALGIRGLVSSFTTRHPCCERRVENIHRIADLLDGLLVKPGETVSVNAIVGPRTAKNGFVPAPTIEEGEMVETPGGGISQFATTLFNALFHGGYDIIERQPHTYWFPRYPMGHEATLSYPKPDLIFRNDTQAGMLFDMVYSKTTITVRIFGDNGGRKVEAKVSQRQNIVQPPIEILPNPAISPEKEQALQAGSIGWTVTVARIIRSPDGTQKEERRKVTYRPKARRVEVHPCRVPEGEKGYTGERCPLSEESDAEPAPVSAAQ